MEQKQFIQTRGRKTAYYRLREGKPRKLILVHGNASSAAFFSRRSISWRSIMIGGAGPERLWGHGSHPGEGPHGA